MYSKHLIGRTLYRSLALNFNLSLPFMGHFLVNINPQYLVFIFYCPVLMESG